jgi:hypothetical protein
MSEINIDDIINEIDVEENEENFDIVVAPSKKVKSAEENIPDVTEEEELMKTVVDMVMQDRQKADDLYNVFVPDVSTGRDRSEGSKEAMTKAVELKISAAKNIIELLKLKKNDAKNSVGVFFGETMSGKKAGINIRNITGNDE